MSIRCGVCALLLCGWVFAAPQEGGIIRVLPDSYEERFSPQLDINEWKSPLVGFQYGDPRDALSQPVLTLHGLKDSHKYICASILHANGGYLGLLHLRNPRKGSTLRLQLPMTVLEKWSPRAGELAILARASARRDCRKDAALLLGTLTGKAVSSVPVYALASLAPNTSASAKLLPASNPAEVDFCERLETHMGDVRLNPQRFGSLCPLQMAETCSDSQTLLMIVRDETRRLAEVSEQVLGACSSPAVAAGD